MARTIDRPSYERLFPEGATYPKNTSAAIVELRQRGLDANANDVEYLIGREKLEGPKAGEGRNREWLPADVDRFAIYLEQSGAWTPSTIACELFNIDQAQDLTAARAAFRENPDLPESPNCFVRIIEPGVPGLDFPARVTYRRMTAAEEARWRRHAEVRRKTHR